nr:transposase [Pseudonocardia sp. HH130629-09]
MARSREDGVTIEQVATDFGVHPMTLQKWLRRAAVDDGASPGRTSTESVELREARKRIRLLEQENEVLRRAAAAGGGCSGAAQLSGPSPSGVRFRTPRGPPGRPHDAGASPGPCVRGSRVPRGTGSAPDRTRRGRPRGPSRGSAGARRPSGTTHRTGGTARARGRPEPHRSRRRTVCRRGAGRAAATRAGRRVPVPTSPPP